MQKKTSILSAINMTPDDVDEFTSISNDVLQNPKISGKAKMILCLLLSNEKGWKHYKTKLQKYMKEGREAINSGLNELEKNGYILRSQYRCKKTKIIKGSVISYTQIPFYIDPKKIIELLDKNGFELI